MFNKQYKSMNRVEIMGFIGKEPEEKNGVLRFSVATNKHQKDGQVKTNWHDIVAFGSQAEFIKKWFHSGEPIIVYGELDYYVAEKDGRMTKYANIIVTGVEFPLTKKDKREEFLEKENSKDLDKKVAELEKEVKEQGVLDDKDGDSDANAQIKEKEKEIKKEIEQIAEQNANDDNLPF